MGQIGSLRALKEGFRFLTFLLESFLSRKDHQSKRDVDYLYVFTSILAIRFWGPQTQFEQYKDLEIFWSGQKFNYFSKSIDDQFCHKFFENFYSLNTLFPDYFYLARKSTKLKKVRIVRKVSKVRNVIINCIYGRYAFLLFVFFIFRIQICFFITSQKASQPRW